MYHALKVYHTRAMQVRCRCHMHMPCMPHRCHACATRVTCHARAMQVQELGLQRDSARQGVAALEARVGSLVEVEQPP